MAHQGLSEVVLRLQAMPERIRAGITASVSNEAGRLQAAVKEAVSSLPVKQGVNLKKLRDSIFIEMDNSGSRAVATVGTPGLNIESKYGIFNLAAGLEYGTVAHIIRARFAKSLAFSAGASRSSANRSTTPVPSAMATSTTPSRGWRRRCARIFKRPLTTF